MSPTASVENALPARLGYVGFSPRPRMLTAAYGGLRRLRGGE
jgi:hypothetical protein